MAESFGLKFDARELRQAVRRLKTNAPKAVMRALNRTMENVRTVGVREIAKDLGLRQADIRDALEIQRATPTNLSVRLIARGARIPLIHFGARGREPSRGKGSGVTYRLPGGQGRVPSGFIATMRSGHRGVFKRIGETRSRAGKPRSSPGLPIVELMGPSVVQSFTKVLPAMQARATEMLPKNLQQQVDFLLRESASR